MRVLERCRQLSRRCVLVSDLRRGWFTSIGVYVLTAFIFREAMTRTDARLSAERAFSFENFELAERAGWRNFGASDSATAGRRCGSSGRWSDGVME